MNRLLQSLESIKQSRVEDTRSNRLQGLFDLVVSAGCFALAGAGILITARGNPYGGYEIGGGILLGLGFMYSGVGEFNDATESAFIARETQEQINQLEAA